MPKKILVLNPGSTSTKLALFHDKEKVMETTLRMDSAHTATSYRINDQLDMRMEQVENFIKESGIDMSTVDMIASRGGPFPPTQGGAYAINKLVVDIAHNCPTSEHASALACQIAYKLGQEYGIPSMFYDSISTNELSEVAKMTGLKGVYRTAGGHVLNARACARKAAEDMGIEFEKGTFVVAHLGGGVSVNVLQEGRIVDTMYAVITPERLGDIPTGVLVDLCYSGKYTRQEMKKLFLGAGGFVSLLGTSDAYKVELDALAGDKDSMMAYDVMAYQLAKAVAGMATVANGRPDAVVFTGSLARSDLLISKTLARIEGLGLNTVVIPGERELEALAEGALRVLNGEEEAKEYTSLPVGINSVEEFYEKYPQAK